MDRIQSNRRHWMAGIAALFCLVALALPTMALAQPLSHDFAKEGSRFRAVFKPAMETARQSVVQIFNEDKAVALGVIVSEDGLILTKGSEVQATTRVRLPDGSDAVPTLVGLDRGADLALLQIPAKGLIPVTWTDEKLPVGSWVASVGPGALPVGVGIVGVAQRDIAPQRGMLGIDLGVDDAAARRPMVMRVYPGSGADRAGFQEGDVIVSVAGRSVTDRDAFLDRLATYRPGESLSILVRRGEKDEQLHATLGSVESTLFSRQARQNMMAGPISVRSDGFQGVLQHDTFLDPRQCGGPLVDLDGEVVGINIARAGRVETYALPTRNVLPIIEKLRAEQEQQTAQVSAAER